MKKWQSSDVICLTSEDEDVVFMSVEQRSGLGKTPVKEEAVRPPPIQRLDPAEPVSDKHSSGKDLVNFSRAYFYDDIFSAEPKDVARAVGDAPYCVYSYVGVESGAGRSATVSLLGHFDERSSEGAVRSSHTSQMSTDCADPRRPASRDTDAMARVADSDASSSVEASRKFELPSSNSAAFYCSAPQPGLSRVFTSRSRAFSPKSSSSCGVPGIAARACQAGLAAASFSHAVDLITDVHRHYSTCPSVNDSSKEVFADAGPYDPLHPASAQCSFVCNSVQKMAACWQDSREYFKSSKGTEACSRIGSRSSDDAVRSRFLFLSHSSEPLRGSQESQRSGIADSTSELQSTSIVSQSYTSSIFRLSAVDRFLSKREPDALPGEDSLPDDEVNVGPDASDFIQASRQSSGEQNVAVFSKEARSFYKAALQSSSESIPGPLGDVTMRNIGSSSKNPKSVTEKHFPWDVLSTMGVQSGVCAAGPQEAESASSCCAFRKLVDQQDRSDECSSWEKMLTKMRPWPKLHRSFSTLSASPGSLHQTQVFAKAYKDLKIPPNGEKTPRASPQVEKWARGSSVGRRKSPSSEAFSCQKRESSSGDEKSPAPKPSIYNKKRYGSAEETDFTDNSSDVIDITMEPAMSPTGQRAKTTGEGIQQGNFIFIVTSDEEDQRWDSTTKAPAPEGCPEKSIGESVWGQIEGFSPWPGVIVPYKGQGQLPENRMVEWYGQRMCSQVSVESSKPFSAFSQYFCANSFATSVTYREAVLSSSQEAASRCGKQFSPSLQDREELSKQMSDWAFGGFQPSGSDGLKPKEGVVKAQTRPKVKKKLFEKSNQAPNSSNPIKSEGALNVELKDVAVSLNKSSCTPSNESSSSKIDKGNGLAPVKRRSKTSTPDAVKREKGRFQAAKDEWDEEWDKMKSRWQRQKGRGSSGAGRSLKKSYSWFYGVDDDMSPDFVPQKKKNYTKAYNKVNSPSAVYTQPDQKRREETIKRIMESQLDIEAFCLCCGTEEIKIPHPLFKGSLCSKCKNNFTETSYRYDEDGYQSYCTICCYGMEVVSCGHDGCHRSYCEDCSNISAGPGTFASSKAVDPWICYLCQPHQPHGASVPRDDWRFRVQEMFANNSAMEFEPHRVYPSIPTKMRQPSRVLSSFDGIGTGYSVSKELGFKVEKYIASEVCEDSVAVASINHDGKIIHVGDVRFISQESLEKWGPFDSSIGGSPCNDLSIVNPLRKGLYEGTGRLFFEYYRISQSSKPKEDDHRPFFWLFENVVFMNTHDKVNICRFSECNPVLVDAVKVSPAHRARYFWGNIPGMSRPIIASQYDKSNSQECLELGREARVTKVRTITTNPNSSKQGKDVSLSPVVQNGREDILWITESEKIFGFPKHYTDARNMNRQQRQKSSGKAWSVPVVRHLFAPLKEYFASEESPQASTVSTSSSYTAPSSPNSPDMQQSR